MFNYIKGKTAEIIGISRALLRTGKLSVSVS
jgi:hypothetical protein